MSWEDIIKEEDEHAKVREWMKEYALILKKHSESVEQMGINWTKNPIKEMRLDMMSLKQKIDSHSRLLHKIRPKKPQRYRSSYGERYYEDVV